MNFQKIKLLGASALVLSALSSQAVRAESEAGPSLGLVGAYSIQNPSVKDDGNSPKVSGKNGFGGGLTGEMVLAPGFGLEADLLYLNHKFSHDSTQIFGSTVSSTYSSGYLNVPVLVRFRPIPLINIGLGGYYSRVIKAWSVSASGFDSKDANYSKNDFGFAAALGTLIPVGDKVSIVVDLRYTRSLTDSARDSSDALKFAEFQVLAGVRFGMR